jgi:uncharacterized protein involved in outer membrane biogenesis
MHTQAEAPPPIAAPPHRAPSRYVWIAAALATAVIAAVALVPALRTVDLTPLRGSLVSLVRARTGRALTVGGGPAVRLSLSPVLVAEDVALANAPWGSRPAMLHVRRAELTVRVLPLLLGRIRVDRVALTAPDLLLETDRNGRENWTLPAAAGSASAAAPNGEPPLLSRLGIREVRVSAASLVYRDGRSGRETRVAAPAITLLPGTAVGDELNLAATLDANGTSVAVHGVVGGPDAIAGRQPFPFRLKATTAGATATLAGTVARLPALAGVEANASLELSDPQALVGLLGVRLPTWRPFRLAAVVRDAGSGYTAKPMRVELGNTVLSGSVTYTPGGPRPAIAADLSAPRIDLRELPGQTRQPPGGAGARPAQAAKLFSSAPLPLGVLTAVDAVVDVRADALVVRDGIEASAFAAHATLENGKLSVDPLSLTLGGGRVSARVRLESGNPPAVAVDLSGRGVALEPLLGVLGIRIRGSGGATDLTASLKATGSSLHGWMASLDGDVRVVVGKGRLEGGALNLGGDVLAQVVAAVNPFHRSESTTELRCGVINVGVERGVVRVDRRVGIETSRLALAASGRADFGKEELDLDVRSRATQGLGVGLASFAGAVRVRGPLAHPSLGLNPVGAAESTATTVGAAAATGGLSIIAKRIWERLFAGSPCATALKAGPKRAVAPKRSRTRR